MQPPHELAADLRRAFSGIVAGNVKEQGMRRSKQRGPFEIHGDPEMMQALDALLRAFVRQRRMKLAGEYGPATASSPERSTAANRVDPALLRET